MSLDSDGSILHIALFYDVIKHTHQVGGVIVTVFGVFGVFGVVGVFGVL